VLTPLDNSNNSLAIDAQSLDALKKSSRQNSPESIKAAAKQFEALFVNMLMKSMRDASPQDGVFDNQQTKTYTAMLDKQLSQTIASRGIGLADVLTRQLSSTSMNAALQSDNGTASSGQAADLSAVTSEGFLRSLGARNDRKIVVDDSQPAHVQAFAEKLGVHAETVGRETGIPAKFMLAQAALESGWGQHVIRGQDGSSSHNLFGIKAGSSWKGKTVNAMTTEYVDGVAHKQVEKFRAYDSYADSFRDYAKLLSNNPRYEKVLANASDVHGFAQGLQRAGYATDPQYANKLTNIIKNNFSG